MTPLSVSLTRDEVVARLERLDLDWGDQDDAESLVDLLLERFTPTEAASWMLWSQTELDGRTPLYLISSGRSREVFKMARRMVAG